MVTLRESVLLARAAYKESPELPENWELVLDSNTVYKSTMERLGYRGKVYANNDTRQIVITHRGTEIRQRGSVQSIVGPASNLLSDTILALQGLPTETALAQYLGEFFRKNSPAYSDYSVTHVGHSLGGFHANLCAYLDQRPAITFDPLGCSEQLSQLENNQYRSALNQPQLEKHFCFFLAYNLINSVNTHVGHLYVTRQGLHNPPVSSVQKTLHTEESHRLKQFIALIPANAPDPCTSIPDIFVRAKAYMRAQENPLNIMENMTMPQKSRVKPLYTFDEDQWVISVINGGRATSGHAFLLVEGLQQATQSAETRSTLFVGQYDITATMDGNLPDPGFFSSTLEKVNPMGTVSQVRAFEGSAYRYPDDEQYYQQFSSRCWHASPENVLAMIESIKKDKAAVDQANRGEGEPIRFQLIGSKGGPLQALFSEENGGLNCAEWCMQKLTVADIQLDVKPKPEKVAGGCSIS